MDFPQMKLSALRPVFTALNEQGVRYLVVGGVAVNVHGLRRVTRDLDIVVQLVPDNIDRAFRALGQAGYRPNVPVEAKDFADAARRESWIRNKAMTVLSFFSPAHPTTTIDVFVTEPFAFDEEYARSMAKPFDGFEVRVVSLKTLIEMKEAVGRDIDRMDVENLKLML